MFYLLESRSIHELCTYVYRCKSQGARSLETVTLAVIIVCARNKQRTGNMEFAVMFHLGNFHSDNDHENHTSSSFVFTVIF